MQQQQAIPMLHQQVIALLVALLAIAGSVMLLRDGQRIYRQAGTIDS